MLKKSLIVCAMLVLGAAAVNAENIKADIQYSPMNISMKVPCNTADMTMPVMKLGVEGNVYRGAKLGLHYETTLGKGDGSFGWGTNPSVNNVGLTDVSYSNFEINAKLPLSGDKWAKDYASTSTRENNFYFNFGYKWNTLKSKVHPHVGGAFDKAWEEGNGWGIGLGYDGYFLGKFGFNALAMYYPSMTSTVGVAPYDSSSYNTFLYRLGVKYDINNACSVKLGYEGENHNYKNDIHVQYNGVVFGLEGRW